MSIQLPALNVPSLIGLAVLVSAAWAAPQDANAQTVVRIGHVAPVSGAQAHFGRDNENGARLAIEELNAQGVQIGGRVQGRKLEVGTGELVRRPEPGQVVVTNQESGDHHGAKL